MDRKEFVTAEQLKTYCKSTRMDYATVVSYFVRRKYFVRILRGIFYVKSLEEAKLGSSRYNHLELVAKAMELKKVRAWYFGLHTALKLNNMTHETFAVEDVVSDKIFRANPFTIAGYKFKFSRLSRSLLDFGIRKGENAIRYSDPDKTILDFIYLWKYNGIPEEKIAADIAGWAKSASKGKLSAYAKMYPKTTAKIAVRVAK
jgi:hypothetical protein